VAWEEEAAQQSTRLTPVTTVNRLLLSVIVAGIGALLPVTALILQSGNIYLDCFM
jgi:hypothetical protein